MGHELNGVNLAEEMTKATGKLWRWTKTDYTHGADRAGILSNVDEEIGTTALSVRVGGYQKAGRVTVMVDPHTSVTGYEYEDAPGGASLDEITVAEKRGEKVLAGEINRRLLEDAESWLGTVRRRRAIRLQRVADIDTIGLRLIRAGLRKGAHRDSFENKGTDPAITVRVNSPDSVEILFRWLKPDQAIAILDAAPKGGAA